MRFLNGLKILNGFKFMTAATLSLVATSGALSADINIDGSVIPSADITSIAILPASGNLNVITVLPGYTVTKNGTTPTPSGDVAISGFSASPSTITEGGNTTLSWTTANAVVCTPTGGAGGWSGLTVGPAGGSTGVTIATAGTYVFTLSCDGTTTGDTATRNVTVTVDPPASPVPSSCKAPRLAGTTVTWLDFWGTNFPGPGYANRNTTMSRFQYKAFEFNTGNIFDNGLMVTVGNTISSGVRTGAFSECPGDFNVAPACDYSWGVGGGITWATNGKVGACELLPDTTYYFNVTFTDGFDSSESSCKTSKCTATLQHVNR